MRQRGNGTYELRVYRGVDPGTGRQRWATRTVHGSKRHATRELAALVEEVTCARRHAGTVADLSVRLVHPGPRRRAERTRVAPDQDPSHLPRRLDADTLAIIAVHRERSPHTGRARFVFSADRGLHLWKPNHATKRFIAARRSAGLEHFRLQDLRHFMATEILAAGVPIATVSQRLSRARCSTTLNVYAHAIPGGDESAAEIPRLHTCC